MARQLILSVDYEIFGNGTGDVRQHIVEPTERMARVCERFQAPLTVFFEVEEYLAFAREARALRSALGYDPAGIIREQIKDLARRGHDIQLHLHPEWVGAVWSAGSWQLRLEKATVDSLFDSEAETTRYLAERQGVIKELSGQPVRVYRAGAFSAQPGQRLLPGLVANGFIIDSSVVHGLWRHGEHVRLDYRSAPAGRRTWRVKDDVAVEDGAGPIWEVPIHGELRRRFRHATWAKLRAKFSKNVPKAQQQAMVKKLGIGRNPWKILQFLFQPFPVKLDFHNLSAKAMLRMIRAARKPQPQDPLDALVLIGHTKEHLDDRPLEGLLAAVGRDSALKVVSFTEIAAQLGETRTAAMPSTRTV